MTARVGVALIALAGSVVVGDGRPARAVRVAADAPLSISAEDVQRYREAGKEVVIRPALRNTLATPTRKSNWWSERGTWASRASHLGTPRRLSATVS